MKFPLSWREGIKGRGIKLFRHSGHDLWFDRPFDRLTVLSNVEGLTTLSKVEGESSGFLTELQLDAPASWCGS